MFLSHKIKLSHIVWAFIGSFNLMIALFVLYFLFTSNTTVSYSDPVQSLLSILPSFTMLFEQFNVDLFFITLACLFISFFLWSKKPDILLYCAAIGSVAHLCYFIYADWQNWAWNFIVHI